MSGGFVFQGGVSDSAQIFVTGGRIEDSIAVGGNASAYVSGGIVQGLDLIGNGSAVISGGIVGDLVTHGSSTLTVKGGSIGSFMYADGLSVINIYGTGLRLFDVTTTSNGSKGSVSGVLADGTPLLGE